MSLFILKDEKFTPDIVHEYTESVKKNAIPLIIDNGSYQCRVGWATDSSPKLVFRNLIAKPRKDRNKKDGEIPITPPTQIGNDIVNIEAVRFQLKTQFDRNVVTHYQIQEQIFDYIFTHLGVDTENCIPHPIMLTECFVNPNYCRQLMTELLFECYDVPSVCYGIDSVLSYKQNKLSDNGLIISIGYNTTHVLPILFNKVITEKTRRINVGGIHMINYLHRLMQLKYPVHVNAITISRIEELINNHCSISLEYMSDLKKWSFMDYYDNNIKKIQLPYTQQISQQTTLTAEQKFEKKRELSRRLGEINARKRDERLAEDKVQLENLLVIKELYEDNNMKAFKIAIKELDITSVEDLEKMITNIQQRIDRIKQKILAAAETPPVQQQVVEEKLPQIPQPPSNITIEDWVIDVKNKRSSILDKRQARRQRRQDLAKRRTAAAQERMRIISQLARKEKGTDDFGMRDEDWDIYKAISREGGDSDSDVENDKLLEMEEVLRHYDPTFEEPLIVQSCIAESHQLHLGVEAIRAPELLFQPSMMGSSEAGLAETIDFILKMFTSEEQLLLANNVFLTGGCSRFPGLKDRLSRELLEMRPFKTTFNIVNANHFNLDAWLGARDFTKSHEYKTAQITKSDYTEFGGDYLKEHSASNKFHPTPAPIIETNE